MKQNCKTNIVGTKTVLVPYRKCHVTKYHSWMQSTELREQTASEALSIEDEYKMQEMWLNDDDKSMVGDVNLFFNNADNRCSAELEVMIAVEKFRGLGLGKEAVIAMMYYGITHLSVSEFTVKIGFANTTSLNLFQTLLFSKVSVSDVFQEVTMQLTVTEPVKTFFHEQSRHFDIVVDNDAVDESLIVGESS